MRRVERLGGRLILMASRALARVRTIARRLRARLRPRAAPGAPAGDPALARRHVRPGARRLLGSRRPRRGDGRPRSRVIARERRQGRRHQDLAARQGQGDRDARGACRAGVRMYTGDDFNYAELIAGDDVGSAPTSPQRCAARHLRCDRARGQRRAVGARGRRHARASTRSSRRPCRCRATSSRRRRASTRPASCSWRGSTATSRISRWSAGSRARASLLHLAELFRLADAAGLLERAGRSRVARMQHLLALHGVDG